MKNSKGVTLAVLLVTIIVMIVIASVGVYTGVRVINDAKENREKENFAAVENMVQTYKNKNNMSGVILPGGYTYPGVQNPTVNGTAIGNDWYLLDANAIIEILDVSYADRYIVNYESCVVIDSDNYETDELLIAEIESHILMADGSWDYDKDVNTPKLVTGMIPIYFENDGTEVRVTPANKNNWYDYSAKKWANAKSVNNEGVTTAYWVWIPRYAYQITSGLGTSTAGTIDIEFLQGTTNLDKDNNIIETTYPNVTNNAMDDFVVHPAFTSNVIRGGWDTELSGMWIAKFMAGYAMDRDGDGISDVANGNTVEPVESSVNYSQAGVSAPSIELNGQGSLSARNWLDGVYGSTITKIKYPVFLPQTIAMNYISPRDSYSICRAMEENGNIYGFNSSSNVHLTKNSEWGAVAYLTQSSKGKNSEVTKNSVNLNNGGVPTTAEDGNIYASAYGVTGNGMGENSWVSNIASSSTGNVSGIYDLSGCLWERTANYVANGHANLTNYASSFASTTSTVESSTEYTTAYKSYEDNPENYETARIQNHDGLKADTSYKMYGDAILENSTAGVGSIGWYNDSSNFPGLGRPFFVRGGYCSNGTGAGVFAFLRTIGINYYDIGFRAVVCPD